MAGISPLKHPFLPVTNTQYTFNAKGNPFFNNLSLGDPLATSTQPQVNKYTPPKPVTVFRYTLSTQRLATNFGESKLNSEFTIENVEANNELRKPTLKTGMSMSMSDIISQLAKGHEIYILPKGR